MARSTCAPRAVRCHAFAAPLLLALAEILDELQAREPVEQLGDLALVDDARAFGDLAVARARAARRSP